MSFFRATVASAFGLAMGAATFSLESFSWVERFFVPFLIPGLIGSMAVGGNVHAFSLWVAAIINTVFYFLVLWLLSAFFTMLHRKIRRPE